MEGEIVDESSLTHIPSVVLKLIDGASFVAYAFLFRALIENHQAAHAGAPMEGLGGDIL